MRTDSNKPNTRLFIVTLMAIFISSAASLRAEDLVVSGIKGKVTLQEGTRKVALTKGQKISDRNMLFLPGGSEVQLLSPTAGKQYTVKGAFNGTLAKYLSNNKNASVKTLAKKYMAYLMKQATEEEEENVVMGRYEDSHATVVRARPELDSLTMQQAGLDTIAAPEPPAMPCCGQGQTCAADTTKQCCKK